MSYLEDDLKQALRRTDPSEDFTERVLARLNGAPVSEPSWWERIRILIEPPRVQWVALSLMASILIPAVSFHYHEQQRMQAQGEKAKEQLLFAVRIAGNKLHRVQQKVLETSRTDTL